MQKYSCCFFLVLLQEIERAANNNLHFCDCESGVYHIISLCVELCKDTKYNLWECRRVLQTVVKYMT